MTARKPFAVVICGGGTAGIEGLLRLRRLAGSCVEVTLLCPDEQLFYRPDAVMGPFALRPTRGYPIAHIAADTGAHWLRDSLAWVDPINRIAHTMAGAPLAYDALLLAVGGRERTPVDHMDVFTDQSSATMYRGILEDIEAARITQIAYVRPEQPSWPLPLYELALLTAKRARDVHARLDIAFITRESQPLHAFGHEAEQVIVQLFHDARIDLHTGVEVTMPGPGHLILQPGGTQLYPQRTITLPTITGPNIRGIPGDAVDRFVSVDAYCRVRHTDGRIFAAGDATDLPLKHGGLGAQQADTAAAGIAHLAGAAGPASPLHLMIQGELLAAGAPRYLSAHLIHDDTHADGFGSKLYAHPPWLPDEELVAAELAPYLRGLRDSESDDRQRPAAAASPSAASGKD